MGAAPYREGVSDCGYHRLSQISFGLARSIEARQGRIG